jgi:hypothetical protein
LIVVEPKFITVALRKPPPVTKTVVPPPSLPLVGVITVTDASVVGP